MKSVVALATVFAVGALSVPNAHNHHEHLHRRHAEAEAEAQQVDYVTQVATNTVVQYVNAQGQPVSGPAAPTSTPAAAPAPAPAQDDNNNINNNNQGGQQGQFKTVVKADNGEMVTANAWQWGNPNGHHGYSWTYQQPASSQATEAPASQPAQYSQPAPAPSSQAAPQLSSAPASASPAPSPSSAAASPAPSPSGNTGSNSYQTTIVNAHNVHRANHSVAPLQWHDGLAQAAQMVANKCSFTHDTSTGKDICGFNGYGQNFACVGGDASENPSKDVSGQWYGEEGLFAESGSYGLANPNPAPGGEETGHFTQVVWKETTHVGCATSNCPNGVSGTSGMDSLFVCNYGPAGNMGGEYGQNVLKPLGQPPVGGTSY